MRVRAVEILLQVDLNLLPGPAWRGKVRKCRVVLATLPTMARRTKN
jgi:hypothetical protein